MLHILYNKLQRGKWGIVGKNHVTKRQSLLIKRMYICKKKREGKRKKAIRREGNKNRNS